MQAGFSIYLSVSSAVSLAQNGQGSSLLSNAAFRDLVLSTVSTYGSYLIASIAYLDPWHMITSFIQYLLLLPGFVNILMVYAFGNLHDVSWGTKGDNVVVDSVPVKVVHDDSGKKKCEVDLPVEQKDIDQAYEAFLRALPPPPKTKLGDTRSSKLKQEDYFKRFRTNTVLLWIFCNVALVATLTTETVAEKIGVFIGKEGQPAPGNSYLTFILWSVSALSLIRFGGCLVYLCVNSGARKEDDSKV